MKIAVPLLLDNDRPAVASVAAHLAARWPELPSPTELEEDETTLSFRVGSAEIAIGAVPSPYPWSDLEGPCATSVLWPNAAEDVRRHRYHWIVTVRGDATPVQVAVLLTKVTASVLASCPSALGIYWGRAALIVPKRLFLDLTDEVLPHEPPILAWVDVRVGARDGGGSFGFTHGLANLGHLEVEVPEAPEPADRRRERLLALASYMVKNDVRIHNGDTVGRNADEKIRIVHAASAFGHQGTVMRLDFPRVSAARSWWRVH